MHKLFLLVGIAAVACAAPQATSTFASAPVVTDNVAGSTAFIATFPLLKSSVQGSVVAQAASNGQGVDYRIGLSGLPDMGGPFMYHVHTLPVPADGNCTATAGHLDPYNRGESPLCDKSKPATCQVGDLSGKYAAANGTGLAVVFNDPYTSTNPVDPSYIGNLSFVVHFANTTRITCANFVPLANASSTASATRIGSVTIGTGSPYASGVTNATAVISTPLASTTGSGNVPPSPTASSTKGSSNDAAGVRRGVGAVLAALLAATFAVL